MLISAPEWQEILRRTKLPAFQPAVQRLRREVADFLAQPSAVQAAPGGYYHDYFCPEHGVELVFHPAEPTSHRCPVDGEIWQGERFDAAWRWFVNNRLSEAAFRLALLGRLESNAAYIETAAKILSGYAGQYARYQQMMRSGPNPGGATYTTLDESVWALPLAWAFDLIRQQLPPEELSHIQQSLFAPVAEHLVAHHFAGIHNFACWHNAAIGTIGVVLDRSDLVTFAVHGEFGFDRQMREGVLDDGLWFEGSLSYHFYTLAALIALAKATRHLPGHDLRNHPALRAMFLAPILAAYPDWSMPATNDCWYFTSLLAACCHGVPPAPAFYEIGYRWYGEPRLAEVLQRAYSQASRDSLDALLFGQEALPPAPSTPLGSVHLAASGYAILRDTPSISPAEDDQQRYLLLKYGPHGGGHGHPDKLNLILYGYGQRFSADLGSPGYGLDLFESWYRQTVSHNTITIDGRSQPPATGMIHAYHTTGAFQVADASVRWSGDEVQPYGGVAMRRVILARPDYFLDIVLVDAGAHRRVDWIYHNAGMATASLTGQPAGSMESEGEGYQHIMQTQRAIASEDFCVTWQMERADLQLFCAGQPGGEIILGQAPGNPPTELRTVLIHRRRAAKTAYLSLFYPYGAAPHTPVVEWLGRNLYEEGWAGCVVQMQGRREQWLVALGGATPLSISAPPVDEQFTYTFEDAALLS
jgi:hypothetical protein